MRKWISLGDKVRVKKEVLDEFASPLYRERCSSVGTVVEDFKSGYFKVQFGNHNHGFYGSDLVHTNRLDEMVREDHLAKQIEMANDISAEVEHD